MLNRFKSISFLKNDWLALKKIIERANRLGIDHTPLEDEQRPPLISSSNNNTPFVWEMETKEKDDLDAQ